MQRDVVTVNNFIPMTGFPDFIDRSQEETADEQQLKIRKKQHAAALQVFREDKLSKRDAVMHFYPHDGNIIGAYAVGDGLAVQVVDRSGDQEQLFDIPFATWARAPLGELATGIECILITAIVPSKRNKGNGLKLSWKAELCSSSGVKEAPLSMTADAIQTSVVLKTLLSQATKAPTAPISLDEKLYLEPAGSTATVAVTNLKDTVGKTVEYAAAIVAGQKKGDKQLASQLLATYDELKKARSGAVDGSTPHDAVHDALLVKYTVALLRSQVVAFQTAAASASALA
jgi:hypothetical protein